MITTTLVRSIVVTCTLSLVTAVAQPLSATPRVADDPAVIATWDAIAMRTSIAMGPPAQLYLAIVSAAMYNAVATIEGRYEPYAADQPRAKAHASPEAAAATAAYRVLVALFPSASEALAADYRASLARVPNGVGQVHGVRVGAQAAAAILALREGDGRNDPSITSPIPGDEPGEWRGTPPNAPETPMAAPWLGYVRPLLIESCARFPLHGPDPVGSAAYAVDLEEVQADGRSDSATRTAAQTRTAWFFSDNVIRQYQEARGLLAVSEDLDIVESARMHALLNMTMADTLICAWRAKRELAFWRPITAIQTTTDPTWTPMIATPPYPEYPSGHASLSGPMANGLEYLFPNGFDLELRTSVPGASPNVPPTSPTIRHYTSGASLDTDTMNARIWLGIHFRKAMFDANELGHRISNWAIEHQFRPVD